MFKRKYFYYVSYNYTDKEGQGLGSVIYETEKKLNTVNEIDEVAKYLIKKLEFESIVILNWIRIKGV